MAWQRLARRRDAWSAGGMPTLEGAGALVPDPVPAAPHVLDVTRPIGHGEGALTTAAGRLARWDVHRRVGFAVRADGGADAVGTTVLLGVGARGVRAWFGCRVVAVLAEPHAAGFTYATLPGHPEEGHERFTLTMTSEGLVVGRIQAWSRPRPLARLAGPLGRHAQRLAAQAYLDALVVPG